MRKRQWKKILSVVLALAMVFSMNVSAFADEVTDPVAVEEPAAEQPVAEAPAEEPAPAAEEPEETPAPVEEEAPAKGEEVAGAIDGWNLAGTGAVLDSDYAIGDDAITFNKDESFVSAYTLTLATPADAHDIALNKGTGFAEEVVTVTVENNNNDSAVYKAITNNGGSNINLDGDVVTIGSTKYAFDGDDAEDTGVAFDTAPVVEEGATSITFGLTTAPGVDGKIKLQKKSGTYSDTGNEVNISAGETTATITGITAVAEGEQYKAVFVPNANPYYINTSIIYADKTAESEEITVAAASVPDPEGTFTVSGYKFSLGEGTTSDNMTYPNGVGQVNLKGKGQVLIDAVGAEEALSINLVDEETELMFVDSFTTYKHLSILGKGTISLKALAGDPVYTKAFEDVAAGVTVSGNTDILISANNAGKPEYIPVFAGEDAGYTSKGGKIVAVAVDPGYVKKEAGVLPDDNKLFDTSDFTGDVVMLSENAPYFTSITSSKVGTVTVSDSRIEGVSVKYGEKLIVFNGSGAATSLANAYVIDVPKKSTSLWLNRLIPGMESSSGIDVSRDTDQDIWVNEDGREFDEGEDDDSDKGVTFFKKYTFYKFTLSSNLSGKKDAANWQAGSVIDEDFNGHKVEANKKYALYTYRKATSTEYKSDVEKVCEFTTLKTTSVSIGLVSTTVSPSYIGDANTSSKLEKLADRTDVVNAKFFDFKLNGFEEGLSVVDGYKSDAYNDNNFTVVDPDGFKVGTLTVNFGAYTGGHAPSDIVWNDSLGYYELPAANDGKEKHYAARVSFIPDGKAPTKYTTQDLRDKDAFGFDDNLWKSGVVSFNVIPAAVKVEPTIQSPAVSGQAITTDYDATSKITGQIVSVAGSPLYLLDGKRTDAASWNSIPAGKYTVTVSGQGLTSTNYELDPAKGAEYGSQELIVVDPDGTDGLKVTGTLVKDVYYGTTAAGIKKLISANFTFGGVGITVPADKNVDAAKIKILASESSNVIAAPELTDTEKVSANTTIYAYLIDVQPKKAGYTTLKASSNAIPITIKQRNVWVSLKDGEKFQTKRGDDLISKVSSNKLVVKVQGTAEDYMATELPIPGGVDGDKFFVGSEINLNNSKVNKNIPKNYTTYLAGYTVSSAFAQNYKVIYDSFDYKVDGRYWVKYILEYGGQGAKTGKRYVSEDVIDVDDVDFGTTTADIEPKKKIANPSWNGILAKGDEITGWVVKRADSLGELDTIDTFDGKATVTLEDYDFAVFAKVSAKATAEGVMVESIAPVEYDGLPHVVQGDGSAKKRADLDITLYDTNDGKTVAIPTDDDPADYGLYGYKLWKKNVDGKDIYAPKLVKGRDYTLSYKNNKNASVAYDETVSGNDGADATFKRIVTDKKMPQVVVKGKGDYKSLKTTVLFDIIPTTYNVSEVESLLLQLANKKLNTKATVFNNLPKKLDADGDNVLETKTYKLKAGKVKSGALSGYTGDYVMEVYKQADNGARTLMTASELKKKVAAGTYVLVYKGVNNFRGKDEVEIEVEDGVLFSKQKFKWTKKVNWAEKVTVDNFKIKVTDKKTKKDIPLVKYAEEEGKAGYYISSIRDVTRNKYVSKAEDWGDECSEYVFENAGTYQLHLIASKKLGKESSIFGTHTLKVEVKGKKLKASDFTIEGKSAGKTVVIDYDGKNTKAPVAVALKKASKFPVTEKSKIPMVYGTKKFQEDSAQEAKGNHISYENASSTAVAEYIDELGTGYLDSGVVYNATLVKSGVYNLAPTAANANVYETYVVRIMPTGQYYGSEADGSVRLTYKRGGIDLKKAMNSLIKVTANPVEVNIGGTSADLWMTIEGMKGTEENPSDNKVYFHNYGQLIYADGVGDAVLQLSYKNNKKVGTATATIKPTKTGKAYFKGSAKVPYTIKTKTVSPIIKDYDDRLDYNEPGEVLAVVNDVVAPRSGDPKVSATLYQVNEGGYKVTKLGKKDYTVTAGTYDKDKGYPVLVTAGNSGNFKFENAKKEAKAPTESYFNTFGKKAKKIVVTLSQGEASGYDAAKKGYVYTGSNIDPKVVSVTVDGQPLSIPADGVSTSSNFAVRYNNDVRVGTATATITLKRDTVTPGLSGNDAYPLGGTVKVKYKIVPHTNNNLILSK